jgi:hypothetical protein
MKYWRLSIATRAPEFESGEIGVHPLLASKLTTGAAALPRHGHLHPMTRNLEGQTS